jgi:hypothetical protein
MSAKDMRAEREVADFYEDAVRPPDVDKGPLYPRAKRFGAGFLDGLAIGAIVRKLRQ